MEENKIHNFLVLIAVIIFTFLMFMNLIEYTQNWILCINNSFTNKTVSLSDIMFTLRFLFEIVVILCLIILILRFIEDFFVEKIKNMIQTLELICGKSIKFIIVVVLKWYLIIIIPVYFSFKNNWFVENLCFYIIPLFIVFLIFPIFKDIHQEKSNFLYRMNKYYTEEEKRKRIKRWENNKKEVERKFNIIFEIFLLLINLIMSENIPDHIVSSKTMCLVCISILSVLVIRILRYCYKIKWYNREIND